jgi:hypothetical protein
VFAVGVKSSCFHETRPFSKKVNREPVYKLPRQFLRLIMRDGCRTFQEGSVLTIVNRDERVVVCARIGVDESPVDTLRKGLLTYRLDVKKRTKEAAKRVRSQLIEEGHSHGSVSRMMKHQELNEEVEAEIRPNRRFRTSKGFKGEEVFPESDLRHPVHQEALRRERYKRFSDEAYQRACRENGMLKDEFDLWYGTPWQEEELSKWSSIVLEEETHRRRIAETSVPTVAPIVAASEPEKCRICRRRYDCRCPGGKS